ncbi:MAG: tetratricopeptide repeat protein [Verrucomicrobiales bacterium]|nr:tetratricopeptide repeat protein [Verrucomicrobiales bacterium]
MREEPKHEQLLDKQIAGASREVERVRRLAYTDRRFLPDLVDALCELAKFRSRVGEPGRSERLYREALTHCEESDVEVAPELLFRIHSLMAYHYDKSERNELAVEHYEQSLALAEKSKLLQPIQIAVIHNNLAMLYKRTSSPEKAEESYLNALREFQQGLEGDSKDDARVASVYNNLGVLYYSKHDFDKACEFHTEALGIRQRLFGNNGHHYDLGQSYNNLAAVHKAMGNYDRAAEFFAKVEELGDEAGSDLNRGVIDPESGMGSVVDE